MTNLIGTGIGRLPAHLERKANEDAVTRYQERAKKGRGGTHEGHKKKVAP